MMRFLLIMFVCLTIPAFAYAESGVIKVEGRRCGASFTEKIDKNVTAADGTLYVTGTVSGKKSVIKDDGSITFTVFLSGPEITGMAKDVYECRFFRLSTITPEKTFILTGLDKGDKFEFSVKDGEIEVYR